MDTVSLDSLTKEEIADEVVRRDKIIAASDAEIERLKELLLSCETYREEWHRQADQYFNELQSLKTKLSDQFKEKL